MLTGAIVGAIIGVVVVVFMNGKKKKDEETLDQD